MQLKGQLIVKTETEQVTDSFRKRVFVIQPPGEYDRPVAFEFVQDKTTLIDAFEIGDEIDVSFNLSSREYNGKYYTSARAWKVSRVGGQTHQAGAKARESVANMANIAETDAGQDDGLPF